jgi:hypothetical protein
MIYVTGILVIECEKKGCLDDLTGKFAGAYVAESTLVDFSVPSAGSVDQEWVPPDSVVFCTKSIRSQQSSAKCVRAGHLLPHGWCDLPDQRSI